MYYSYSKLGSILDPEKWSGSATLHVPCGATSSFKVAQAWVDGTSIQFGQKNQLSDMSQTHPPPPPPRSTGMVDYRPLEGQDIIIHLFWVRMGQLWGEGGGWKGGLICPLENPTNKFLRSGHPPPATPPTSPHPNPSNLTLNYVPVSAINPSRGP